MFSEHTTSLTHQKAWNFVMVHLTLSTKALSLIKILKNPSNSDGDIGLPRLRPEFLLIHTARLYMKTRHKNRLKASVLPRGKYTLLNLTNARSISSRWLHNRNKISSRKCSTSCKTEGCINKWGKYSSCVQHKQQRRHLEIPTLYNLS